MAVPSFGKIDDAEPGWSVVSHGLLSRKVDDRALFPIRGDSSEAGPDSAGLHWR